MLNSKLFMFLMAAILINGVGKSESRLVGPNVCSFQIEQVIANELPVLYGKRIPMLCKMPPCYLQVIHRNLQKNVTIYKCCDGYDETGDKTCNPRCEYKCTHGICIEPNKCECDVGYKGPTCDEASCSYAYGLSGIPHCEFIIIGIVVSLSSLILSGLYVIYRNRFHKRQSDESSPAKSFEPDSYQWDNPLYFHHKVDAGEKLNVGKANGGKDNSFEMKTNTISNVYMKEEHRASKGSDSSYITPKNCETNEVSIFHSYEEVLPPPIYENIQDKNIYEVQSTENIYTHIA